MEVCPVIVDEISLLGVNLNLLVPEGFPCVLSRLTLAGVYRIVGLHPGTSEQPFSCSF